MPQKSTFKAGRTTSGMVFPYAAANCDAVGRQAAAGFGLRTLRGPPGRMIYTRAMVEQIHASGRRIVLAISGGGSGVIGELLRVPGGSRSLVEAVVPYSANALTDFLGHVPEQACSAETAIAMARRAFARASGSESDARPVGVGVTASLVTDRPKQGAHRAHIAATDGGRLDVVSVVLDKGARDRAAEEDLVARATLLTLAGICGVETPGVASLLTPADQLSVASSTPADDPIARLLARTIARVTVLPDGQLSTDAALPGGVLAGSFNPLHRAHLELVQVASAMLGAPVAFELSAVNADKPALTVAELRRRLEQFEGRGTVELTCAPTFREKARVLPGVTFVVGVDTAARLLEPRYYDGSTAGMVGALDEIGRLGGRFLVAGRADAQGRFVTLADLDVPASVAHLFEQIPESRFRLDVSSTALRSLTYAPKRR